MKEQDAAHSLTETRIDYLTKMVLSHLGDYAIKGAIIRSDVQDLVVGSRLLQAELTRLRSELQQLQSALDHCKEVGSIRQDLIAEQKSELQQKDEVIKELTDELVELRKFDER